MSDEIEDFSDELYDYNDTGPFCRHWGDPSDCEMTCANCGHRCTDHDYEHPGECLIEGCDCPEWEEE